MKREEGEGEEREEREGEEREVLITTNNGTQYPFSNNNIKLIMCVSDCIKLIMRISDLYQVNHAH